MGGETNCKQLINTLTEQLELINIIIEQLELIDASCPHVDCWGGITILSLLTHYSLTAVGHQYFNLVIALFSITIYTITALVIAFFRYYSIQTKGNRKFVVE